MPVPPALDPASVPSRTGSIYPPPHDRAVHGRAKRALTGALGLTQFGVNLTELAPGAATAIRHWHTREDEFVYVLSGEAVLVTDSGEQVLTAGQCAGFPAGVADGHCIVNRSDAPVLLLEVGSRDDLDEVHYPDTDLHLTAGRYQRPVFTDKAGNVL